MTVYIDPMTTCLPNANWRWREACHLFTDGEEAELVAFAMRIGLRQAWLQRGRSLTHFDLTANKRRQAVASGAVEVTIREAVAIWQRHKREQPL